MIDSDDSWLIHSSSATAAILSYTHLFPAERQSPACTPALDQLRHAATREPRTRATRTHNVPPVRSSLPSRASAARIRPSKMSDAARRRSHADRHAANCSDAGTTAVRSSATRRIRSITRATMKADARTASRLAAKRSECAVIRALQRVTHQQSVPRTTLVRRSSLSPALVDTCSSAAIAAPQLDRPLPERVAQTSSKAEKRSG